MASGVAGINCDATQLQRGQCSLDVYQTLGIRKDQPDTNVGNFVSDITLSATFFIGTVVAIGLMYSGWVYITAKDDGAAKKGKDGIRFAFIGLLLVMGSYSIIRLVQYLAKG